MFQGALTSISPVGRLSRVLHGEEKHISLKHLKRRFKLEMSTLQTLESLHDAVSKKIKLVAPIDYIYKWEEEDKKNNLYYVKSINDPEPVAPTSPQSSVHANPAISFQTMDEFYEALQNELDDEFKEELVTTAKKVFREQGIGLKQVPTLTNEELKEFGLKQGGLREAILKVLGKE
ncbi:hypothetical protein MP638_004167 [Amoeboaphelidium occidentale]|nr:hypothetical protein MP638_004167 [Amoeboaphelidium occidentale]